jgi:hypothetical protein
MSLRRGVSSLSASPAVKVSKLKLNTNQLSLRTVEYQRVEIIVRISFFVHLVGTFYSLG